jgi:hypothetical protein
MMKVGVESELRARIARQRSGPCAAIPQLISQFQFQFQFVKAYDPQLLGKVGKVSHHSMLT